ncbi:MAG TPA: DUF4199 domain-containing protein, partial [Thermoanaerobaculia bacterium]|nr:DUF4199 domain-containing protein [Thermoanaerobaculia bacterium]
MKKIVLTFGLISGAIVASLGAILMPLCMNGTIDYEKSEIIGYTTMFFAFLLVFFGIRSYRDNVRGGAITFGKAFQVGILMTLITCTVYVVSWEIVYFNFMPDFVEKYSAYMIARKQAGGASDVEIAKTVQEMADFKRLYANPLFNVGMTFMEIFPVGLLMTLLSAAILRRKPVAPAPATA